MTTGLFAFPFDERLGIPRPCLTVEYEELPLEARYRFELGCQQVVSEIPARIRSFEQRYLTLYESLSEVTSEQELDERMAEMNEISSCIADLNVLYFHIEGTYIGANVSA
jgi:hypothetical protein